MKSLSGWKEVIYKEQQNDCKTSKCQFPEVVLLSIEDASLMGKKLGWKTDVSFLKQWRLILFQRVKVFFFFFSLQISIPILKLKEEKWMGDQLW